MTQPPAPSPDTAPGAKVSELEAKLAEAAAQVAKVQAELSQARAADPNLPDVPVPYAGTAPVVMINGQPVAAGQAIDISAMMGGFFGGAGAAGATIPPVVAVNGQVVSGGQPLDLSAMVGADTAAQIRSSLEQLGLGGQLAGLFGGMATGTPSTSPPPSYTQPGPAQALPYTASPGEVPGSGNRALAWLAAVLVIGLIGVIAYLMITG